MPITELLAGTLLVLSTLAAVAWSLGLLLTGRRVEGDYLPFEAWPQYARDMRWTVSVGLLAMLLGLLGFAILSTLLRATGDGGLGSAALVLLVLATALAILEGTHHVTLGIWSAEEAAREGTRPAFTEPLSRWASRALGRAYYLLWLAGLALYGGALLLGGLLPFWAGGTALAWGLGWLAAFARRVEWTWGILVPVPIVVGAALLLGG